MPNLWNIFQSSGMSVDSMRALSLGLALLSQWSRSIRSPKPLLQRKALRSAIRAARFCAEFKYPLEINLQFSRIS